MDKEVFLKAMAGLSELSHAETSELLLETYWNALKDIPNREFIRGVDKIIKTSKFYRLPPPSEIREAVEGSQFYQAERAWEKVLDAFERFGISQSFMFDDPKINTAVHILGGWVELCLHDYNDLKFVKQEFLKIYPSCEDEGRYCVGQVEIENKFLGYRDAYTVLGWDGKPLKELPSYKKAKPLPENIEKIIDVNIKENKDGRKS